MKSAVELAMEKMRRLDKEMAPEEKEAGRQQHYTTQGETLANRYLKNRSFTLEKVETSIQTFPEDRRETAWQGFWYAVLSLLRVDTPSERAEDAVACCGGEMGRAVIKRLHHLRTVSQQQEAESFASCVAHFEGHARLQRLAAAGIQVDYDTVTRQSRYWQEQKVSLSASQTVVLEEAKASFWGKLFDSVYPSMGKNKR